MSDIQDKSVPQHGGDSNIRENTFADKLMSVFGLATVGGFLGNGLMTFQPNMSLSEIFVRYVLPSLGAAGMGGLLELDLRLKQSGIKKLESINDVVSAGTLRTAKFMAVSSLGVAAACGISYLAQNSTYEAGLERKERAEKISKLPVLSPDTVVEEKVIVIKKTAQENACRWQKSGNVLYVSPLDNKEYQVSCNGHQPK